MEGVHRMGEFVRVTEAAAVLVGELAAFDVGGTSVAVANVGGTLYAFGDTCTHLRCSLAEGSLDGTVVTCTCHGSQFDVTTGEVLRGPAKTPVRSYAVRVENDELRIQS
jgi:nitrite reductase/ring-hydroxylating ferredoxin subunit